jgi:hypothetical protein
MMAPVCKPGWAGYYLGALQVQLRYGGLPEAALRFRVGPTGCRVVVVLALYTNRVLLIAMLLTAPLAKLAQGESGVPANLVRTAWVQFRPPPAWSMLRAFHQAVCLPLLRIQ